MQAIEAYKRAIELEPDDTSTLEALHKAERLLRQSTSHNKVQFRKSGIGSGQGKRKASPERDSGRGKESKKREGEGKGKGRTLLSFADDEGE